MEPRTRLRLKSAGPWAFQFCEPFHSPDAVVIGRFLNDTGTLGSRGQTPCS